jgi:hypothetical protein
MDGAVMKIRLSLLCLLLLLSFVAVSAQDVDVEFDKSVDFSKFKTYSWVSGVPANNPFIDQRIRDSIDGQLATKGLRQVKKEGDLSILYFAALGTDLQVASSRWVTTGNWMTPITSGISVRNQMWDVHTGTLVVCLSNATGKNLLWRGTAKTMLENKSKKKNVLEAMTEDARNAEKKIKKSVEKMFKQYPAGKSAWRREAGDGERKGAT